MSVPTIKLSKILTTLKTFFETSKKTLRTLVVFILVLALEQIFEKGVFKCPSKYYFMYGNLFIIGPAICLFNLTILLNMSLWDVITGCWQVHLSRRWLCKKLVQHVLEALLPPCVWLILALVQTHYFVCARLGPKDVALKRALLLNNGTRTKEAVTEEIEGKFARAATHSQMIAWCLFDTLVILATMAVCVRRCYFLRTEGSLPYMEEYGKLESTAAVEEFKAQMNKRAEESGKKFVTSLFEDSKEDDVYNMISEVRQQVAKKYPRATGNLSMPYRVPNTPSLSNGKCYSNPAFETSC